MPEIPPKIPGIAEVAERYDGFIIDVWGVLHDGIAVFPGVIPALKELKKRDKKVWLLSNAPRRAYTVEKNLTDMGISSALYGGIMTSGEAVWLALKNLYVDLWGKRCLHIGQAVLSASLYENLDVEIVREPGKADFLLVSGVEDVAHGAQDYMQLLEACLIEGLPMVCANPDKVVHVGDSLIVCPGTLADVYEDMGGTVVYFGKPYRAVYDFCFDVMQAENILALGDGMPTDIAGAGTAGIDSVLVTTGIHRDDLVGTEHFLSRYPHRPTYLLDTFSW